jgi:2-polyprenylphenol 6-hydroxylase
VKNPAMRDRVYDVAIMGAGMVGAALACLLARAGFSVALVESQEPPRFDPQQPVGLRVSALSPGSQSVLEEAGAWRQIAQQRHCAYRRMRVEDRDDHAAIEFNAGEFGLERLGTIVENDLVQASLWQCLQTLGGIDLYCPAQVSGFDFGSGEVQLQDGQRIRARLIAGADGADSLVRRELGIGQKVWEYGQVGIVAVVHTARPNPGLAWQRFLDGGPLALLPLSDGTSSLVWSLPDARARGLMELSSEAFCAELELALNEATLNKPGPFGQVITCGPRAAFPLRMQLSDTYTSRCALLVGDAAHVVHPLAGQGVNIGFSDVAGLVETLLKARKAGQDIARTTVLQSYARWRRSEAELMAQGVHGIRSVFTPDLLSPVRRLGMGLISRSWVLREAFIRRATGRNRNAPALNRGVGLADLLRNGKS